MPVYSQRTLISPQERVIDLAIVKQFLHINYDDEDSVLQLLINASIEIFETHTGKALLQRTLQIIYPYDVHGSSRVITLPLMPVIRIVSCEGLHNNADDVWHTIDQSVLTLRSNKVYPQTPLRYTMLKFTYETGIATSHQDISEQIKVTILNAIGYLYENRGECPHNSPTKHHIDYLKTLYNPFRDVILY